MAIEAFNPTVAARTRTANYILKTAQVIAKFELFGGLQKDLVTIKEKGELAEACNHAQGRAVGGAKRATTRLLLDFVGLQREYSLVMGVVQAVRGELDREGGNPEHVQRLDGILRNEATLTISAPGPDGKRKVSRSEKQEAVRAEIARDAADLLDFTEVHPFLTARRVDPLRLKNLQLSAEALSGQLSTRTAAKGARKVTTAEEQAAVREQKAVWGSCYRILARVAEEDPSVAALLKEAARNR